MKDEQTLFSVTNAILSGFEEILKSVRPDMILVHGDTITSFVIALSAFYTQIPVGHVEAGLRTYNLSSPYPEEFNRQCVDLLSTIYFAPTELAKTNLLKEGKSEKSIYVTGNTVIDALSTTIDSNYKNEDLQWASCGRMILITTHRRENIGKPMKDVFVALRKIVTNFSDVRIVFPIHKNPEVRRIAKEYLEGEDRIRLIEPLDVASFHNFMSNSYFIMTDSGGIQEEASALGIPVLVLRDTTERPEGVEAGALRLVGTKTEDVYKAAKELLTDVVIYDNMKNISNVYGDGHSSDRICNIIADYLG
jgi:UDP-N-acetylglucosamine 2-epimerase (non-hydrolysing)